MISRCLELKQDIEDFKSILDDSRIEVIMSSEFRKNFKNISHDVKNDLQKLCDVISKIHMGKLDSNHKEHKWNGKVGNEKNCRECHVKDDLLLIYKKKDSGLIKLLALGRHSDFKK
ncbi:mRNA interferase YafQ [Candidatus Xenohaliotis californiensis]|uniref:mRNA interferase YafQ n=1 Tax=Candidatus Xenohaliotis californiensis TaxID=84677 RepID=A0ABP0EW10_9RICK|nr:mRNA interferase YafQ [Candidatus Xenohaliotis californiensis]